MNDRLTDLEIHCMHLEQTVQELHEALFSQQQTIDRLSGELLAIKAHLRAIEPSPVRRPEEDEPPPHY